ncbi:MAG: helix-turn-helix domain-containing protein [Candidatus Cryptobacteroides sp.]
MLKDIEYLTMNVSGWEMVLANNKMSYFILHGAVMSTVASSLLSSPAGGKILGGVSAVLSSGIYAVLLLRSVTGGPVIGYTHDGKPYSEKDVDSCAYLREKSRMSELMYTRICQYLDENRPYLDPEYSLDNLARALISNKSYISKVINEGSGLNFCQLMNRYRVNFAMEMFRSNPQLKTKDLSEISGFNSQVTFNMAFKLFCGTTPGVWCKECRDDLRAKSLLSRTGERVR